MSERPFNRRELFAAGIGIGLAGGFAHSADAKSAAETAPRQMVSAAAFGIVGDGIADDTAALQAALDATFAPGRAGFLVIPPGNYRVTRSLRIATGDGPAGNITRHSGVLAHGARLVSAITDGGNVLELISRATIRFVLIEGLDILGTGREGHGLYLECDRRENYLYNFCLRDIVVQGCGGDGCRLLGNVFEGQVINSYFRKNRANGVTFAHGFHGGILSAIHVFGCIFGDNGHHGATLANGCYDVAFHGCYFLLNAQYGLLAENGCTLLSNCGFENNHDAAKGFDKGDAGVSLQGFATLVGCTAYSMFNQTGLIRAYVTGRLVMVGCAGSGDARAKSAGLAVLAGRDAAGATLIGCSGAVAYADGFDGLELGGSKGGIRFGSTWDSANLPMLGEYRLWVDRHGRLRIKKGAPGSDEDGIALGA